MLELGVLTRFIRQEEAPTGIGAESMGSPSLHLNIIVLNDARIDAGQHDGLHDPTT
jgi:hypothetical protein